MTEMKKILLVLFLAFHSFNTQDAQTEYYKKIIEEALASGAKYEYPTSNSEFRTGYESTETLDYGEFDFIVIGAGSSGSVLTTRLAEIPSITILLLEAGGEETDFSQIPALAVNLQLSDMNWGYLTVPKKTSCLGMKDQRCVSPRGKVLGGSSSINAAMYVRGNAEDFNQWARIANSSLWSYENVLPYFKKSEKGRIDGDPGYHGKNGLLSVQYAEPAFKPLQEFIEANSELNQKYLDYNGREQIGCARTQFTIKNGQRDSTNRAFLKTVRDNANLNVTIKALATKILIDNNNSANGVEFVKDDKKYRASATREVILSGGTINSPQLLILSGIGPKKHLQELEIPVIADLPVGENLIEHPLFQGITFRTNRSVDTSTLEDAIFEYTRGGGILSYGMNVQGLGFVPVSSSKDESVPMIEYLYIPSNVTRGAYNRAVNFNDVITEEYVNKFNPSTDIHLHISLLHEKSRGSVTLKSSSPIDLPNIDFNMFSDEHNEDVKNMIEGARFMVKLAETETFQRINATFLDYPVCNEHEKFSDAFWECAVRHLTTTIYHPLGTTRMGTDASNSVVDAEMKVHGIKNLRVADCGVMPTTFSGHTNAPTIMLAEKLADLIKNEYLL